VRWETAVPLVALTIACLAAVTGGRFLSGLAGQVELEAYSGAAWFERLIVRPGDLARSAGEAILPPGSDADIFARFTAAGVFLLPALVAIFLALSRPPGARRVSRRLSGAGWPVRARTKDDPVLWSWVVRPISTRLEESRASFDRDLLEPRAGRRVGASGPLRA